MLVFTMSFLQTITAPSDLIALQWIVITVLAGVVAYLFRLMRKEQKRHVETEAAILKETLKGLREVNETIHGLANGLEAMIEQFSILFFQPCIQAFNISIFQSNVKVFSIYLHLL